jgi:hypothetical protein
VDDSAEGKARARIRMEAGDPGLGWELHRPTDEEQYRYGRILGFHRQGGTLAPTNSHRGTAASWVCVALGTVGFGLGGLAIVLGWSVPLLVTGAVLMASALVVAVVWDILSDVVLDPPRYESEEPHQTPLHRIKQAERSQSD